MKEFYSKKRLEFKALGFTYNWFVGYAIFFTLVTIMKAGDKNIMAQSMAIDSMRFFAIFWGVVIFGSTANCLKGRRLLGETREKSVYFIFKATAINSAIYAAIAIITFIIEAGAVKVVDLNGFTFIGVPFSNLGLITVINLFLVNFLFYFLIFSVQLILGVVHSSKKALAGMLLLPTTILAPIVAYKISVFINALNVSFFIKLIILYGTFICIIMALMLLSREIFKRTDFSYA